MLRCWNRLFGISSTVDFGNRFFRYQEDFQLIVFVYSRVALGSNETKNKSMTVGWINMNIFDGIDTDNDTYLVEIIYIQVSI